MYFQVFILPYYLSGISAPSILTPYTLILVQTLLKYFSIYLIFSIDIRVCGILSYLKLPILAISFDFSF